MFNVGDKVKIIPGREQQAFRAWLGVEFTVHSVHDEYIKLVRPDGQLHTYNGVSKFRQVRFTLAEAAAPKAVLKPKYADINGTPLKVGDYVALGRKIGTYKVVALRENGIDGEDVQLEHVSFGTVNLGENYDDDNPRIRCFDKWNGSVWYPTNGLMLRSAARDGMIGEYYGQLNLGQILLCLRSGGADGLGQFQIVGYLDGKEHADIGDLIILPFAGLNWYQNLQAVIAAHQKKGTYGVRNKVVEEEIVDENKLQEELAAMLAPLIEKNQNPEAFNGGPADFTIINHYGNKLYKKCHLNEPCHYDLKKAGYNNINAKSRPYAVIQWINRIEHKMQGLALQGAKDTVEWIIKGPWKKAFTPKQSYESGLKNGLFCNIERTGNEIGSALLAIRQLTEFPTSATTIGKLREMGYPIEVAWMMQWAIGYNDDKKTFNDGGLKDRGHTMLHSSSNIDTVLHMLKKGLPKEAPENRQYKNWQGYDNIYGVVDPEVKDYYGGRGDNSVAAFFRDRIKAEGKGVGFNATRVVSEENVRAVADELVKKLEAA